MMKNPHQSFCALLSLLMASCSNSVALYPVTGTALVNGQPAVGASVTFLRKDATERLKRHTTQGIVDADGKFALAGAAGVGAEPGEYIVLVEWKEGAGAKRGRAPALSAPDRLKRRYLDPERPLLTAVVEAKANNLPPFKLK